MFARLILLISISAFVVVSLAGKVHRYWVSPKEVGEQKQQVSKRADSLDEIIRDAGFMHLKKINFTTRNIDETIPQPVNIYMHPSCFGKLYVMPLNSPDEANLLAHHSGITDSKPVYVYAGKSYAHYPTLLYFIDQNWQAFLSLIGTQTRTHNYPLVIVSIQTGDCDLQAKVDWQGLWR